MLTLREIEELHIEAVLCSVNFNKTRAAEVLGISLRTMTNKCREYGFKFSNKKFADKYVKMAMTMEDKKFPKYFPTNEERLKHADSMINKDYL